jgi:hypothetical protein
MSSLLYDASATADVVKLPARRVLALDGQGAPEGESFKRCIGAIYGLAYTLKFARKAQAGRGGEDFKIGPLEARWWADGEVPRSIAQAPRESWRWRLRMAMPSDMSVAELNSAIAVATSKGKLKDSAEARQARLERVPSERYGRILHIGPYAGEGASFERIVAELQAAGLTPGNAHLELYLSDPQRTRPEKLKTVLLLELAER